MMDTNPKAVKVENLANILRVEFDNGVVKYLQSHWVQELSDAFSLSKKGKGKRRNLLLVGRNRWIGSKIVIEDDGTVILNDTDKYSSEELWEKGKSHINEL